MSIFGHFGRWAVLVVVVVTVIGGFYLLNTFQAEWGRTASRQSPTSNGQRETTLVPSTSPTGTSGPPVQDPTAGWKTYLTPQYKIRYPSDWQFLVTPLEEEALFKIKPSGVPASEDLPTLFIERRPVSTTSLETQQGIYARIGLHRTTITFHGVPAIKFHGTVPTKTVSGKIIPATVQTAFILLEKSDYIYTIGHSYESNAPNNEYENIFQLILSTFEFTP